MRIRLKQFIDSSLEEGTLSRESVLGFVNELSVRDQEAQKKLVQLVEDYFGSSG